METKRLILRRFVPEDFPAFRELIRDKMSAPSAAFDEPYPTDDEGLLGVLRYFVGSDEFFAVERKDGRRLIGFVALNRIGEDIRNLGYCIHTEDQGIGYGGEAASAAVEYAKTVLHIRKLTAGTAEQNTPSVRLLLRAGFTEIGRETASFAKDANGTPITFTGLSFEKTLSKEQ